MCHITQVSCVLPSALSGSCAEAWEKNVLTRASDACSPFCQQWLCGSDYEIKIKPLPGSQSCLAVAPIQSHNNCNAHPTGSTKYTCTRACPSLLTHAACVQTLASSATPTAWTSQLEAPLGAPQLPWQLIWGSCLSDQTQAAAFAPPQPSSLWSASAPPLASSAGASEPMTGSAL